MKLDIFCHVMPRAYFERAQAVSAQAAANILRRTAPLTVLWDVDERLRLMDGFDDYAQIPSLAAPPVEALGDAAQAAELARLGNDEMAELTRSHPDRLPSFVAALPMNDVDAAVEEAERAVAELGAAGVQVYTHVNGLPLDDPRFEPLFALMAGLDRPIWVHPARNSTWPDYPDEPKSKYEIWWLFGWPFDTSVCMARLIFAGVLQRHAGLKLITHHAGGMIPFFSGRVGPGMDQFGARTPPEEQELVASPLAGRPLDAFRELYADTAVFGAPHALRCAVDFFGVERMLFASDMPFDPVPGQFIRDTIADVEALGLSESERAQIYEENARKLLGVPAIR